DCAARISLDPRPPFSLQNWKRSHEPIGGKQPPEALEPNRRYRPDTVLRHGWPLVGQKWRAMIPCLLRARPPGWTRGLPLQTLPEEALRYRALSSAVCDVADDAHCKREHRLPVLPRHKPRPDVGA